MASEYLNHPLRTEAEVRNMHKDPKDQAAFDALLKTKVVLDGQRILHHYAATKGERDIALSALMQMAFSAGLVRGVEKLSDELRRPSEAVS